MPAGVMIAATQTATHCDPANYENADKFDGFRFYRLRAGMGGERNGDELTEEETQEEDWRNRLTGTGLTYLAFGGGKHVW